MMIIEEQSKHRVGPIAEASSGTALAHAKAEVVDLLSGAEQLPESFFTPQESEDLLLAAKKMAAYVKDTSKVVYFMLAGGPLIVSAAITPEQAVINFQEYKIQSKREALGVIWTEAVKRYEELEQRICKLSATELLMVTKKRKEALSGAMVPSANETFFTAPTLEKAIDLAARLPGINDADKLIKFVEQITALLPTKAVSAEE